jgi:hypothetical protein
MQVRAALGDSESMALNLIRLSEISLRRERLLDGMQMLFDDLESAREAGVEVTPEFLCLWEDFSIARLTIAQS